MKTQFKSFGGGLLTGCLLFLLVSASLPEKDLPRSEADSKSLSPLGPLTDFHNVKIDDFYKNVARYRSTHIERIKGKMPKDPQTGARKNPSRMFIYSVDVLRDFFTVIEKSADKSGIKPDELAIRFYYGVYPRTETIPNTAFPPNPDLDYGSLLTLFMVPNYWDDETKSYRDLDIKGLAEHIMQHGYPNDPEKRKNLIESFYLENKYVVDPNAEAFLLSPTSVPYHGATPVISAGLSYFPVLPANPAVINQGQLCPPNCPSKSLLGVIDSKYPNVQY
jgi:hypothetical protein